VGCWWMSIGRADCTAATAMAGVQTRTRAVGAPERSYLRVSCVSQVGYHLSPAVARPRG
jgi:hypothetical protein